MSDWHVIVPESTTNMVLNPSAEIAGNFFAEAGTTVTRSTTYNRYGLYSYRVQCNANNEGIRITTASLPNAIHYATVRVRGTLPAAWDWSIDNANWHVPALIEQLDSNWALYGVQFPAAQCNGQTTFRIHQNGAGAGDFYLDGIQIEQKTYWTTYVDGDQQGCEWNSTEHSSTSSRSAASRAGGRQRDLQTVYYFDIGGMIGVGIAPQSVIMDEYAILPGAELNTIKVHPRPFTLTGVVRGTGYADLHDKLSDLQSVVSATVGQPVRLRYTGSTIHKEIAAHYEGGMEGNIQAEGACYWQRMGIRFLAEDPYWHDYGGTGTGGAGEAAALTTEQTIANVNYIIGRVNGEWTTLGVGTNATVETLLVGQDALLYVGGQFTQAGGVNRWRVASWNDHASTWASLGAGLNNTVYDMALRADGDIFIGGMFTDVQGGPGGTYNRIVRWDGAAYNALGVGADGTVQTVVVGLDGTLYIGGAFANVGGVACARIAKWDGAAWTALGTGMNNTVYDLAIGPDDTLYAVGAFTTAGGVAVERVARWDGSAWSAMGSPGFHNTVFSVEVDSRGVVYAGGTYYIGGGAVCDQIAQWNGTAWTCLGGGVGGVGSVAVVAIAPDDMMYVGGTFAEAGDLANCRALARWIEGTWAYPDLRWDETPGAPNPQALVFKNQDPVISENYDVYVGFVTAATVYAAEVVTVTNNGTVIAYPRIIIESSGGSYNIRTIRNETTGKELNLNYDILDGERLTIDLRPTQQSIVSSMFGRRLDAILANSDMGDFVLQTGDNDISFFAYQAGAGNVTAWIEWQVKYSGL